MKTKLYTSLLLIFAGLLFASCDVNNEEPPTEPTIEGVEIGLNNNAIGVIGRDFHFNMNVVAGELIEDVQVKIDQRSGETYSHDWSFEITWDEYQGVKNTNVHKHFDIAEDAAEGEYNFTIIVNDQNGATLKEERTIALYHPENLPVDPKLSSFLVRTMEQDPTRYIYNSGTGAEGDGTLIMGDSTVATATIGDVKGDGKLYVVLINKKHDHKPESIDAIDYSKTIIWNITEHTGLETSQTFFNATFDSEGSIIWPVLIIGAEHDNNLPTANSIDGEKAWESGTYYLGVIYENTTYDMGLFSYIEVTLTM